MMRLVKIVILSDIHGNLDALRSITETYDELWVLGDLVNYGPQPSEVIDFVRGHAAVVVSGNHDFAIGAGDDPHCSPAFREMARAMQDYTQSVLTEAERAWLRGLPHSARREVDGTRFLLCHATPSDLFRYGPAEAGFWRQEAAATDADILLVGHTHLPFDLNLGDQRVVNPGSVGQPKHGRPEACYAVWNDGEIELRSQPYDFEATIDKLLALPIDKTVASQLADVLRRGHA
jgi:putative phosphoesterase